MSAPLLAFVLSILCGACSVALWCAVEHIRKCTRCNPFIDFVLDFVWWALSVGFFCVCIWHANSMQLRLFEFIGAALGAILYYLTLYKLTDLFFSIFFSIFFKIIKFILKILLTPCAFLYKILVVGIMKKLCFKKGKVANNDSPQERST